MTDPKNDDGVKDDTPTTDNTVKGSGNDQDLGVQRSSSREDFVHAPGEVLPADATVDNAIGVRKGMFGISGTGDVSGYGDLVSPTVFPGVTDRPYGGWFDETAEALARATEAAGITDAVEKVVVHRGEITFHIRRQAIAEVAKLLRDDEALRFEALSGVSGVHYPEDAGRELHVVYHLLSMTWNRRIRLEVSVPDADPRLASVTPVWPTADWHERETWDMFSVVFEGHPSLTRILMPDDWPGHPQRKDYPLGGIPVEYKGATIAPPDQRRSYN